jgi:hypothetical protein
MHRILIAVALIAALAPRAAAAQAVFHSTQAANLPTAVLMPQGSWLFEISHRFDKEISSGSSDFWGLDGPAYNRLGLAYSISDRVTLGVLRTNVEDNYDVSVKVGALSSGPDPVALELAVLGGVAWNTDVFEVDGAEDNEMQAYGQLIANVLLGERVALGLVPSYLYNARLEDFDEESAFALGINGQIFLTGAMSFIGEWIVTEAAEGQEHDPATFGIELETRGHFFKLIITNQALLNPTQYLGGTPTQFEADEWRFGFNIQRLLPF